VIPDLVKKMAELSSHPMSIQTLYTWYRENKLFVNRRYQRKLVWTQEEKQKLIGSILKKYPIPALLIAEMDKSEGTYEIIDGLQRIHSIVSFIENSFPTDDQRYFDVEKFPTAKLALSYGAFVSAFNKKLLEPKEVTTILDYVLPFSVMRSANEVEINDVFDRINTYGHRLSEQERRQAGIENEFSVLVRELACSLRGDSSATALPLGKMPQISIDLPMANHGYQVKADEVFWVKQGVLRSTDRRDSADEQCIADIAASIVTGEMIERSKDILDSVYEKGSAESNQVLSALGVYGSDKLKDEFKYCVSELLTVCESGQPAKLRNILFSDKKTTNPFPSVFAVLLIAFHEIIVREEKAIADYKGVRQAIVNLSNHVEIGQKATPPEARRKNVDLIKGLIGKYFVIRPGLAATIYRDRSAVAIEESIRRSEIELANYELKQGLLAIDEQKQKDQNVLNKAVRTICAMANNGKHSTGKIIVGVTDKDEHAAKIKALYGIEPKRVGKRYVVGIEREARALGLNASDYFSLWKDGIRNSQLSEPLRGDVLSTLDYNSFYGLGVIIITIRAQTGPSYVGDDMYWRVEDATEKAKNAKDIHAIGGRY
jgi:hypothetical protein